MSKLLIDEYPLLVPPKLAKAIGLNEAIFLQQLHYWLTPDPARKYKPHYREWEGKILPWVYNTYKKQEDETGWGGNFPFWSARTIMRIVANLRERNLIITTDKFNKVATDRTLWYTINRDELDRVENAILSQSQPTMTDCQSHESDNLSTGEGQPVTLLPETTIETNPKTNKEAAAKKIQFAFDERSRTTLEEMAATNPLTGLSPGTDGHQRAVDKANGSHALDPIEEVAKHLRWLCDGVGVLLPTAKNARLPYLKAARALLERTDAADWRGVCAAVDDWNENTPETDKWWHEHTKSPSYAIDHLTSHYWGMKNGKERTNHAPNDHTHRVRGRLPAYSIADPASFRDQPPDDETG